jgi:phenylalanine-4-hydroxylase
VKAVDSGATATAVYDSGLQVCGTFSQVVSGDGRVEYIKTTGPSMLCYDSKMLPGHGRNYHSDGFGSPVGKLKGHAAPLESLSDISLETYGIIIGQSVVLDFESGVRVVGLLNSITRREGKIILMTLDECLVSLRDHVLFMPAWGLYDMAVGEKIVSVYSGPADQEAFGLSYPVPVEKTHKIHHTSKAFKLHEFYRQVTALRKQDLKSSTIKELLKVVIAEFPKEWLLLLEIYELLILNNEQLLADEAKGHLMLISEQSPDVHKLINNGIQLFQPDYQMELKGQQ